MLPTLLILAILFATTCIHQIKDSAVEKAFWVPYLVIIGLPELVSSVRIMASLLILGEGIIPIHLGTS